MKEPYNNIINVKFCKVSTGEILALYFSANNLT